MSSGTKSRNVVEYPDFVQLGDDDIFVPCPVNLLIPEHIHGETPTPAPQPGEPGPQGPPGPQVWTQLLLKTNIKVRKRE